MVLRIPGTMNVEFHPVGEFPVSIGDEEMILNAMKSVSL